MLQFIYFSSLILVSLSSDVDKTKMPGKNYRLPTNVIPDRYDIELSFRNDSFLLKQFAGTVHILLTVVEPTKKIQLHSSRQKITLIELVKINDIQALTITNRDNDTDTDIITINFGKDLERHGVYRLTINYIGTLGDDDMYGIYQSTYKNEKGEHRFLASTQFESVYARRAFPCFDEPKFKAVFALTIKHPSKYGVIANTEIESNKLQEGGIRESKFKVSKSMSTYLLAFIMSDFTNETVGNFSVWSRPNSANNREVALQYGPKILELLSDITGIEYYGEMDKMDVVAIPDFAAGAMENWGLVTYREIELLDDAEDTSDESRQGILMVIAHEFAHQWFGDYVTLDWWSDTWLNEGFANYFESFISDKVEPEFGIMSQFVVNVQQRVFQTDSVRSALPLSSIEANISTPSQIDSKFDAISYSKGGSVVRMMSYFIGQKNFFGGLKQYLTKNKYKNTKPAALFVHFTSPLANVTMGELMNSWINKPGLPVVTVSVEDNTISFTQERFLLGDVEKSERTQWYIPISITTKKSTNKFRTDSMDYTFLVPNGNLTLKKELADDEWLIINNKATGYFRTNYDTNLWKRIIVALKSEDFDDAIHELNRAQLVDDIFNLARIGKVDYKTVFELAAYLEKESNYYAWTSAFNAFSFLLKRTGPKSSLGKAISSQVLTLMATLNQMTYLNTTIDELNAVRARKWACNLGNDDCISDARDQFKTFKDDFTKKPNPDDRGYIYCTALRNSEHITEDWTFLREQFTKSKSAEERSRILTALGCTPDEHILMSYLNESISEKSDIRKQDAATVFTSVYSGTPEGVGVAFQFLKDNYKTISQKYKGMNSLSSIVAGISDRFTTRNQIQRLKDFIGIEDLSEDFKSAAQQALDTANTNVQWLNAFQKDLERTLGLTSGNGESCANAIQASIVLVASLAIFLVY